MRYPILVLATILLATSWTAPADTLPPIACNLKALTADQRQQLSARAEHVIAAIISCRETSGGYTFRIDQTQVSVIDVAQWLDLWRRCCPFYDFQIDLHTPNARIDLTVQGRPGVKEFIPIDSPRLAAKLPKR